MVSDPKRNKDLIRRMNDQLWSKRNLDLIDDHVEHNTAEPEPIRGRDAYKENVTMLHKAFPHMDVTIEHLVAEGSLVAYHYTISGVHEGQLMDFGPTGTEVEFSGISTGRTEDSQVVEGWTDVDIFGLIQQIGAIPEE